MSELSIKAITYSRGCNLGNYETSKLEAVVEIAEGEDPDAVFEKLRCWAYNKLGL